MTRVLLRFGIRAQFRLTRRGLATAQIQRTANNYVALVERLGSERGARAVRVPPLPGVDDEMRDWSMFMILQHNVIVNRIIAVIVPSLARGIEPVELKRFDAKRDVLPAPTAGLEQVEAFRESVDHYLQRVEGLHRLRGTRRWPHPIFGDLDAHGWHCLFGFHLGLHLRQADTIARLLV